MTRLTIEFAASLAKVDVPLRHGQFKNTAYSWERLCSAASRLSLSRPKPMTGLLGRYAKHLRGGWCRHRILHGDVWLLGRAGPASTHGSARDVPLWSTGERDSRSGGRHRGSGPPGRCLDERTVADGRSQAGHRCDNDRAKVAEKRRIYAACLTALSDDLSAAIRRETFANTEETGKYGAALLTALNAVSELQLVAPSEVGRCGGTALVSSTISNTSRTKPGRRSSGR